MGCDRWHGMEGKGRGGDRRGGMASSDTSPKRNVCEHEPELGAKGSDMTDGIGYDG